MKNFFETNRIVVLFLSLLLWTGVAETRNTKKRTHLRSSIKEAMKRSNSDQDRFRDQMNSEADQRIQNWKDRQMQAISIGRTGTSEFSSIDVKTSDPISVFDSGEDHSGLTDLKTEVELESTDINFDEELREVSSKKD